MTRWAILIVAYVFVLKWLLVDVGVFHIYIMHTHANGAWLEHSHLKVVVFFVCGRPESIYIIYINKSHSRQGRGRGDKGTSVFVTTIQHFQVFYTTSGTMWRWRVAMSSVTSLILSDRKKKTVLNECLCMDASCEWVWPKRNRLLHSGTVSMKEPQWLASVVFFISWLT